MRVGVVVIGRNEGERLKRCLESVVKLAKTVVYVDSGSTDNSVNMARGMGVHVVDLDMSQPFTAARARNTGFERLNEVSPGLDYVQFIDGDCELHPDWLGKASSFLDDRPEMAMVCGRLRERFPEQSIYNRLCDIEWDTPVGEAKACGGIALVRTTAFERLQGFRADLIAGEEPELCVRLRHTGWRVWRLDAEMALHDAAMFRFGQWWKRAVRGGHAFAEGTALHGSAPERHWVRESNSAWLWGLGIPLTILLVTAVAGWAGLLLFAVYPAQIARLALRGRYSPRINWWRALFLVVGKFPETLGQIKFHYRRLVGAKLSLIEYK
ncbi:MAG: glycosyl transferase [Hydrogenophilales bacterium 28-61-23]|nr:MAG: glycosyl transferase [Hydrogenophilales bacterium 28-61-23]